MQKEIHVKVNGIDAQQLVVRSTTLNLCTKQWSCVRGIFRPLFCFEIEPVPLGIAAKNKLQVPAMPPFLFTRQILMALPCCELRTAVLKPTSNTYQGSETPSMRSMILHRLL